MHRFYKAEKLKNCHSAIGKLTILMPLISVILSAVLTNRFFTIDSYNWWYMMLFPGFVSLICGLAGQRDKKMGNRPILTLPEEPKHVWDGKVLYVIREAAVALIIIFAASVVIAAILQKGMQMSFAVYPSLGSQVAATALLLVSFVWQVPFCLMLQQIMGIFPMLLLNMGTYFVIAATASLKSYFFLIPQAIASRLMCSVIGVLPNGLPARPGEMTFSQELLDTSAILPGIAASVIWLAVFWFAGRKLYERAVRG